MPHGRIISTRKDVGALTTVESTQYDDLGRVVSTTDILGRVTRTQYSDNLAYHHCNHSFRSYLDYQNLL